MGRTTITPGLALAVAILAVSWGSIFVRFCESPPLFIAFYRLAFSAVLLLPFSVWRRRRDVARNASGVSWRVTASGLLLAVHFGAWISSLAWTTIASSVVLVSTQPIFSALLSRMFLAEKAPPRLYLGVGICLAGTALIAGGDLSFSAGRAVGDLLALVGAAAVAGHLVIGRSVRIQIPFPAYLLAVYGGASLFLGLAVLAWGGTLLATARSDYFWFLMMALIPSLIGHTCLNWAVRHLKVFHVGLAAFGEPILASWYAYLFFGETVLPTLWAGAALVFLGILLALPRRADALPVN